MAIRHGAAPVSERASAVLSAPAFVRSAKRLAILPAVVLIQTCLGGVYAWSAFVPFLTADDGLSMSRAQFVFGLAILTFTVAMVAAGQLLTRWGPRRVALLGALFFSVGHMITAGAGRYFPWLIGGYGLSVGIGIGFGYVAALTSGVQWFPQRKGMVTGVAVAGFGLGGLLLASLAGKWTLAGWSFQEMFITIGWSYGAALVLGALFLFRPPGDNADGIPNVVAGLRFAKSRNFRVLAAGMFCGTFAGLLVIGLLKPMGLAAGLSPENTTKAIGGLAAGNVAGRLVWGWLYDRLGYRTIPAALVLLCLAIGGMMRSLFSPAAFIATGSLVGFGFGACFVLYAAQVAATHGVNQVGRIYPFLFLSYGIAGIAGPLLGGLLHDWTGRYSTSLIMAVLVSALGAWLTWRGVRESRGLPTGGQDSCRAAWQRVV